MRQELIQERSQVCQLTSDKVDTLQRLHVTFPLSNLYEKVLDEWLARLLSSPTDQMSLCIIYSLFQICVEERDALQKEKSQLEYDMAKYETRTLQVLDKLESEAQRVSLDYEDKYKSLDQEGKKVS